MKILTFTTLFPNRDNPDFGIFVKNRMQAVSRLPGVELKVVAPVPWFPPLRISRKWYAFSQIPRRELIDGIEVHHPRYLVTPKVGMTFYGFWMFLGALGCLKKLRKEYAFDLIDAHFVFPDGLAAVLLGRVFGRPVVISARGTDIVLYRTLPLVKHLLRAVLRRADHLIAVSRSLGALMIAEGASRQRLSVIPNGIDPDRFFPKDKRFARRRLGLDEHAKILLSVCALVELKGVHLLIEAAERVKTMFAGPFRILVVGKGPEREKLQEMITQQGLADVVTLVGAVPNVELVDWYNAADVFFLGSSREGWPNVVSEALACGTPVVATNVNGIPEILDHEGLGLMVERSSEDFARGIGEAFSRDWDRAFILSRSRGRTWDQVANGVFSVLREVVRR